MQGGNRKIFSQYVNEHRTSRRKSRISQVVTELLSAFYERIASAIPENCARRRKAGLMVERKNDPRQVLTQLGSMSFHRTYYQRKDGTYCHPVDEIIGIAAYKRVSGASVWRWQRQRESGPTPEAAWQ